MKCELAVTIFYFLGRAPSKVFFKSAGDRPPRPRAGSATPVRTTRAPSHSPTRCVTVQTSARIDSRDDRQRRHGPAGPVR